MKLKRRKRKPNKQIMLTYVLLLTLLFIGMGYSILNTNLGINGSIQLSKATCKVGNKLYNVLKCEAENGGVAKEYTGEHQDSLDGTGEENIYYYTESGTNNVIFGGFCWNIIRTTDTGGVKIVYNGVPSDGKCNNTGTNSRIGRSAFNTQYNSPAYVGYMYNPDTLIEYKEDSAAASGLLYGTNVTYSNGTYTLTNTSTTKDKTHHYTCNNTTGTCTTVRYYYYGNYYVELSDGRNIEQALNDMLYADNVNKTNSAIKTYIDNWYRDNMTSYTKYLEDAVWCNDRSLVNTEDYNYEKSGWNQNGGLLKNESGKYNSWLNFKHSYYTQNGDLSCTNETDKFTTSNTKAKLEYPVGLLTAGEHYLGGANVFKTLWQDWLASPSNFNSSYADVRSVFPDGSASYHPVSNPFHVRPAVSLVADTEFTSGEGTTSNPYVIKLD